MYLRKKYDESDTVEYGPVGVRTFRMSGVSPGLRSVSRRGVRRGTTYLREELDESNTVVYGPTRRYL